MVVDYGKALRQLLKRNGDRKREREREREMERERERERERESERERKTFLRESMRAERAEGR